VDGWKCPTGAAFQPIASESAKQKQGLFPTRRGGTMLNEEGQRMPVIQGTDYPFRDGAALTAGVAPPGLSAAKVRPIERDNALRLLPRLRPA